MGDDLMLGRKVEPANYPDFEDKALVCPECGGNYLHHESVSVYDRHEDSPTSRRTTVNSDGSVDFDMAASSEENPSGRRDGLVIGFWCEYCNDKKPRLAIVQHKGQTFLWWLPSKPVMPLKQEPQ